LLLASAWNSAGLINAFGFVGTFGGFVPVQAARAALIVTRRNRRIILASRVRERSDYTYGPSAAPIGRPRDIRKIVGP
jgi:hypothetical protein